MADIFEITNQRPTTIQDPGGVVVQGIEVTFTTKPHQLVGRVQIPTTMYSREEVQSKVGAAAALLEEIQAL